MLLIFSFFSLYCFLYLEDFSKCKQNACNIEQVKNSNLYLINDFSCETKANNAFCNFYSIHFNILGDVQGGFPSVGLPPFSSTLNDTSFTFIDMLGVYGSSLAFCPLIAFLEHIAIVKAFSMLIPMTTQIF